MRNASGHQGENEWQRKKGNRNTYNISPIKLVTRKFLAKFNVVVVQNNGKKMYEIVCFTCKVVFFLLIRPTDLFWLFSFPSPLIIK